MFCDPECSTFRKIVLASFFAVGMFLIPNDVQSATSNSATLQWAANQESDLAGYRVYHGTTSGSYGSSQNVGKTTTYQYASLESNKTHYFSITAYDMSGNESSPSLEVAKTFNSVDTGENRPVITAPTVVNVTKNTPLAVTGVLVTDANSNISTMNVHSGIIGANSHGFVNIDTTGTTISFSDVKSTGYRSITLAGTQAQLNKAYATLKYTPDANYEGPDDLVFYAVDATGSSAQTIAPVVTNEPDSLLSLSVSGEGTVTSSPASLSCPNGACSGTFSPGSSVTLTATPSNGSTFSGWGGACTGTGSCMVALARSSVSVSANFVVSPPPSSSLSVSLAGSGSGIVTGGVSCSSGTCSGTFSQGSSVTLAATASNGSTFSGWTGACTGTGSCVVALSTSSASVSANFVSSPPPSSSLSVTVTGNGEGRVTSSPSGLTCSGGACTASFPQGTVVTLTSTAQSGTVFQGWNGVCSGNSQCAITLSSSSAVTATFVVEKIDPVPPKPTMPLLVNFQPTDSQVPPDYHKDDGSVFSTARGYGWNQLLNGTEEHSTADQTLDTFVSTSNQSPNTWNFALPNGIYYATMVLGNPNASQGPHWVSVEGLQLAKQVKTAKGEYLIIADYMVEVSDSTFSLTLGNSGQGQTTLNYLVIHEKQNSSMTTQILTNSFETTLVASNLISGTATKLNPVVLVKKDKEEKELKNQAIVKKKQEEEAAALVQAKSQEQATQEVAKLNKQVQQKSTTASQAISKKLTAKEVAKSDKQIQQQQARALALARFQKRKAQEVAKLNGIKEKIVSTRQAGGPITLRNILGGS